LSDVQSLTISDAKMTFMPDFSLVTRQFPQLKQLYISNSGLKYVERKQLASFHQLTQLVLVENLIEHLAEDVFNDLVNLESLYVVYCKIRELPPKLLWKLPKLKTFRAARNRIELIPRDFFKYNRELESFEIAGNRITRIEVNLTLLPKLKSLDLTDNDCITEENCYDCDMRQLREIQEKINFNCDSA
jgi:Leucine-rich repeat (LRR) protein